MLFKTLFIVIWLIVFAAFMFSGVMQVLHQASGLVDFGAAFFVVLIGVCLYNICLNMGTFNDPPRYR